MRDFGMTFRTYGSSTISPVSIRKDSLGFVSRLTGIEVHQETIPHQTFVRRVVIGCGRNLQQKALKGVQREVVSLLLFFSGWIWQLVVYREMVIEELPQRIIQDV